MRTKVLLCFLSIPSGRKFVQHFVEISTHVSVDKPDSHSRAQLLHHPVPEVRHRKPRCLTCKPFRIRYTTRRSVDAPNWQGYNASAPCNSIQYPNPDDEQVVRKGMLAVCIKGILILENQRNHPVCSRHGAASGVYRDVMSLPVRYPVGEPEFSQEHWVEFATGPGMQAEDAGAH